jgi:catechol 2,3-dioxygenase-like lactoylglutathione lyase family enzyme
VLGGRAGKPTFGTAEEEVTLLSLDHAVIAVRDLTAAIQNYERLLGLRPSWRGDHPAFGTSNALFRLANTYIELLTPNPEAPPAESPLARGLIAHLDGNGEGLFAIALGTADIDGTIAMARERGIDINDPGDGEGVDLETGARRVWRSAFVSDASLRGVRVILIQHVSPVDTLPPAKPAGDEQAVVTGVDHTVLMSADLDASLGIWHETLGLDLRRTIEWPATDGQAARRLCFLRLGGADGYGSILELAGDAEPARRGERDLLWGISYRARNVEALVDRLRSHGIDVSDPRDGRAPGTKVADLRPGFSNDVRTLFIQREFAT